MDHVWYQTLSPMSIIFGTNPQILLSFPQYTHSWNIFGAKICLARPMDLWWQWLLCLTLTLRPVLYFHSTEQTSDDSHGQVICNLTNYSCTSWTSKHPTYPNSTKPSLVTAWVSVILTLLQLTISPVAFFSLRSWLRKYQNLLLATALSGAKILIWYSAGVRFFSVGRPLPITLYSCSWTQNRRSQFIVQLKT